MKLTYEQKLKAYKDWKSNLKSPRTIAKELHVKHSTVEYFLKSADRHSTIYNYYRLHKICITQNKRNISI